MPNLSISNAWNETTGIVKRDAQLLFPLAFMLVSLPAAIFQALVPTEPQAQPEPGLWLLLIIPLILITVWGTLAISWLAMRPGSSGSAALGRASTRLLPLIGAVLLLMVGAIILSIPIFVIAAALGGAQALAAGEMTGGLIFAILALMVLYVFFWVRLMLITPSAAAEEGGPIALIKRSWSLTRGFFWKLLGFVLLVFIVFLVLSIIVGAIGGILIVLVAGQPEPGSLASFFVLLLGAIVNMVVTVYFTALIARIYLQLAGTTAAEAA